MDQEKQFKITAEPQTAPEICKFILEENIYAGPSVRIASEEEAKGSALAQALFSAGNIAEILISGKEITIRQALPADWRHHGVKVGQAIREAYASGKPLVSDEFKKKLPSDEEIKKNVTHILETEINPAVAAHGGYIEVLDVKNNDLFIKMGGGCQGCGMASVTLKQGVEQTIRHSLPHIGAIYDTTDHAGGQNPYYSPGK